LDVPNSNEIVAPILFNFPQFGSNPSPFGHAMDTIRRKILSERADYEKWTIKQLHIAATVTASAIAVFQFLRRDYSYSGAFVQFALKNRATVQIVVQVLAHILALLQIYSIRTSFNFAMRLYLPGRPTRLNTLGFYTALGLGQIDFSLPFVYLLGTTLFLSLCFVPGALWAGALTPIIGIEQKEGWTIQTPAFTNKSADVWDAEFRYGLVSGIQACERVNTERGFVPYCPVPGLKGFILEDASTATSVNNSPRKHSKLDNPDWTYQGNSYGVGSSIGLSDPRPESSVSSAAPDILSYSYLEKGFMPVVTCIFNSSCAFSIVADGDCGDTSHVYLYAAKGYLPNSISPEGYGQEEAYPMISGASDYWPLLAWTSRALNGRNMIAIATGRYNYTEMNQTQCEVQFNPTLFNVSANVTARSIVVTEVQSEENEIPAPVITNVMNSMNLLPRMSSSLYSSVLGEVLTRNILNMRNRVANLGIAMSDGDVVLAAVADSFSAVIDDLLVGYGAVQIVISNDTISTPLSITVEAARIGEPGYIYATLGLNLLTLFLVLLEAARTRFWSRLRKFNHLDLKSAVVASSAGGSVLAGKVDQLHRLQGSCWSGDPADPILSNLRITLEKSETVSRLAWSPLLLRQQTLVVISLCKE
jgi:hypothetical protein